MNHHSFQTRRFAAISALIVIASATVPPAVSAVRPDTSAPTANDSNFRSHTGLASAIEVASKDGALILLVFGAQWCAPCQILKSKTLDDPNFIQRVGALHLVQVDIDSDPKTARQFEVRSIPDLLLMTAEMKIISRSLGYHDPAELLNWIESGRRRAAQGIWEGIAPAEPGDLQKCNDELDVKILVRRLDARDPVIRDGASAELKDRKDVVPSLIEALEDEYLGLRIGASELLRRRRSNAPKIDPWAPKFQRDDQIERIREWWQQAALQPAPVSEVEPEPDHVELRAIEEAIAGVLSNDSIRRTRGMSTLVRIGAPALPSIRQAIHRATENHNDNALWVLEDVRWSILVPRALETKVNARRDLAHGTSEQRQAAATRLGGGANVALAALRELIDDPDPRVQESAVHTLSKIGGEDALAAIAVLLAAADSNLRMIAAQQLGRTKIQKASQYLVDAVKDPDEVVACVAIAALEEVRSTGAVEVLTGCLSDSRWRIRATAAEAIGKLQIKSAAVKLLDLLKDDDTFVIKSALMALQRLKALPDNERMLDLIARVPDLTQPAVEFLLERNAPQTLSTIEQVFDGSNVQTRRDILSIMAARRGYGEDSDEHWRGVLEKAIASSDTSLRRLVSEVLTGRTIQLTVQFLTRLLEDEEFEVRRAAASPVVRVAAYHWGVNGDGEDVGILSKLNKHEETMTASDHSQSSDQQELPYSAVESGSRQRGLGIQQMHRKWHHLLGQLVTEDPPTDVGVAWAYYVTGDGITDLPVLASTFAHHDVKAELPKLDQSAAVGLLLKRLPWPEGHSVLAQASDSLEFYVAMLESIRHAPKSTVQFLLNPERMATAVESAQGPILQRLAQLLVEHSRSTAHDAQVKSDQFTLRLRESKKPVARAMAYYLLGTQNTDHSKIDVDEGLLDPSPWVRRAAIQGVLSQVKNQIEREEKLQFLLTDSEPQVATLAAIALLQPGIMHAIHMEENPWIFRFKNITVWSSRGSRSGNRPATIIDRQPAFLQTLRDRIRSEQPAVPKMTRSFVTLLAQYGDFAFLDEELMRWDQGNRQEVPEMLLLGVALTKDPHYLIPLRVKVEQAENKWELQRLLQWLRGVRGEDARQLRHQIDRMMRYMES